MCTYDCTTVPHTNPWAQRRGTSCLTVLNLKQCRKVINIQVCNSPALARRRQESELIFNSPAYICDTTSDKVCPGNSALVGLQRFFSVGARGVDQVRIYVRKLNIANLGHKSGLHSHSSDIVAYGSQHIRYQEAGVFDDIFAFLPCLVDHKTRILLQTRDVAGENRCLLQ